MIDAEALARAAARGLGTPVRIEDLRRLSAGASRETYAFDAVGPDGERIPLVLRRDPPGRTDAWRAPEIALLRAAAGGGVPVATIRFELEPADGLGTGFVMERVDGETIPRRILRDERFAPARARMAAQCGEILARIHALDPPEGLRRPSSDDTARAELATLQDLFDSFGQPHAAFELAFRWLAERAPRSHRLGLVHGDFRHGNFVVGEEGIRAVLDWELAHLGDPAEDLGWLCVKSWRFGKNDAPVGGFGAREELLAAYAKAGGGPVDPVAVSWWESFGTLRWGVICIVQAFTHLSGGHRSVELAAIGRRACETEWDLLELMRA